MDFQRKPLPFLHRGMNWNAPVEKLGEGQLPWAKNVRVLEQGTISAAHGHTEMFPGLTLPGETGTTYVHTMSRFNLFNPGYENVDLRRNFLIGYDGQIAVGQDTNKLIDLTVNPVKTPGPTFNGQQFGAFSGNPLSVVDAQPAGAAAAWKYVADSQQMVTVGYYPTDTYGSMARALTIGLPVPSNITPVLPVLGAPIAGITAEVVVPGNLTAGASYQWCFAYRRVPTGARSNPSAATRYPSVDSPATPGPSGVQPGTAAPGPGEAQPPAGPQPWKAVMNVPQPPFDPQTDEPDTHVAIDVYRFGGAVLRWALVGSVTWVNQTDPVGGGLVPQDPVPHDGGLNTFTDNTADIDLLAAPAPPQATDQSTGLTRFNMYQPFVTADVERRGQCVATNETYNGHWELHDPTLTGAGSSANFNVNWLPGSTINVSDLSGKALGSFTIYQMRDAERIELMEGSPANLIFTDGSLYNFSVPGGTLQSGQPLPHLWGPYGIGQSGSYLFACGDPNGPGTLYWTNGNDPDSTDIVNNIQVSTPSERLMTGCVYAGQPYCWSNERMFTIYPSLTVFGQFTTAEQVGAKGVWLEWSLSVQNNGFADTAVSWRGKDGIYSIIGTSLPERISDPLYAFFPHDGTSPLAPTTIMPFLLNLNAEHVGQLDDTQPKYHRLTWFHGMLFYDFVALEQVGVNIYSTLVYDSVNVNGWVSLDQPFSATSLPVGRAVMVGANDPAPDATRAEGDATPLADGSAGPMERGGDMFVSWGGTIYTYFGFTRNFFSRIITRAEDMGDPRALKLYGDFWVDATIIDPISFFPLVNFHQCAVGALVNGKPQPTDTAPAECLDPVTMQPPIPAAPATVTRRATFKFDFSDFLQAGGRGLLQQTLGLDIQWQAGSGQYVSTLNNWQPSFVPKPEAIAFRASDRDDQGRLAAKYLRGINIEANTFGLDIPIDFLIDGTTMQTITINHDFQTEHPYGFSTPLAGYEFQVQASFPTDANWQLFKVAWIWDAWPDSVAIKSAWTNLGDTGAKFLQGFVAPIETGGQPATYTLYSDDDNTTREWIKQTLPLIKTSQVFDISQAFVGHQFQVGRATPSRIWDDEIKWIWQPMPELTYTWESQWSSWGYCNWWHLREAYIAIMGGSGTPTLSITTEFGSTDYSLGSISDGQYMKVYRVLAPTKSLWKQFKITCPGGVRVFAKDSCVMAKAWGSTGPYDPLHPFGGASNETGAPI